ncbi:C-type lectin domain family 4 member M-like isoform X1 [Simochromis diagramma]|uniref:C-type lectin domain family 4 member M-like isoform X1 n=1 Tax=Simochromis diagramma TaxID=43689 RepID=UPI001A7E5DE5|nr:C-type lectin domain family 4 member M-like isoform X1 [Simochromis diagramma]
MSSIIDEDPELSMNVKYSKGEDRGERLEGLVLLHENVDSCTDHQVHVSTQDGEIKAQKKLPAVKRSRFRAVEVKLVVLYLLMLAGITTRYILVSLEKQQLQKEVKLKDKMEDMLVSLEKEQLKDKMEDALNKSEFNKLHFKHNKLNHSYNELQTEHQETKRLNSQLQSRYDELSKNHSQLQEEVKKLKEKIEEKCPEEWTRFGSSCYFKSTESKTWSDSRRDCQDKGADLVMINSEEEQEFINELNMRGYSWIGLRSKQTSGEYKWEWVDGSALTERFWAEGHEIPSSGYYGACCDGDGKWTQSSEYRNYKYVYKTFICEK